MHTGGCGGTGCSLVKDSDGSVSGDRHSPRMLLGKVGNGEQLSRLTCTPLRFPRDVPSAAEWQSISQPSWSVKEQISELAPPTKPPGEAEFALGTEASNVSRAKQLPIAHHMKCCFAMAVVHTRAKHSIHVLLTNATAPNSKPQAASDATAAKRTVFGIA